MRTQAVGIQAQLLALAEGHVLVRKTRKFEILISNLFLSYRKKTIGGGGPKRLIC